MPDDFMIVLVRVGSLGAAAHYCASLKTITRWRREANLPINFRARRPSRSTARPMQGRLGGGPRPIAVHRDYSHAGQAAGFLQKNGPIYRCTSTGKAVAKGSFWNRGGHVLTDTDVIERASRMGWSADQL